MDSVSPKNIIRFETAKRRAEQRTYATHDDVRSHEDAEDLAEVESSIIRSAMLLHRSIKRAA